MASRQRGHSARHCRKTPDRMARPIHDGDEPMHNLILAPLVALVLWTFVMWAWLYATRIPAIRRAKIVFDPARAVEQLQAVVPPEAQWKADNYNHLMEQPTLFYAVVLAL